MRKKIILLFIGISLNSFAQNPQLSENTWYLQDLIINNQSNLPPANAEVSSISLEFFSINNFLSTVCESIGGTLVYDDINQNFTFNELNETLGGGCMQITNGSYEFLYFNYYYSNIITPFDYNILINGDSSRTLTITSPNGDQAIYGNQTLAIKKEKQSYFSIFFDSTKDTINLKTKDYPGKYSIKIFDSAGNLVLELSEYITNSKTLNIQQLANGLYIVIAQNTIGDIFKKKILR